MGYIMSFSSTYLRSSHLDTQVTILCEVVTPSSMALWSPGIHEMCIAVLEAVTIHLN